MIQQDTLFDCAGEFVTTSNLQVSLFDYAGVRKTGRLIQEEEKFSQWQGGMSRGSLDLGQK